MTDVTLRATKGSPLTHTEMDNNQIATRSGRKNMVIGGNFSTNPWQRGTSFTAVASGEYTADRFLHRNHNSGTGVVTHVRSNEAPSVAQVGFKTSQCLRVDVTTADATIAANHHYDTRTTMEGYDYAQIAQNDFVLSFWHKHTKAGTYCVAFINVGGDRSYVAEYTQSVSETWEKATIKVTASPSAGTWDYTTGRGLRIAFSMGSGTDYHTTADAWQAGNFRSTVNQVNAMDSTSNFMRFNLIQIEEGIEATDFERRPVAEELNLCRRYFDKSYNQDITPGTSNLVGIEAFRATSTTDIHMMTFSPLRTTPTVVLYNPITGVVGTWRDEGAGVDRTVGVHSLGARNVSVAIFSSVDANEMRGHWTVDAEL